MKPFCFKLPSHSVQSYKTLLYIKTNSASKQLEQCSKYNDRPEGYKENAYMVLFPLSCPNGSSTGEEVVTWSQNLYCTCSQISRASIPLPRKESSVAVYQMQRVKEILGFFFLKRSQRKLSTTYRLSKQDSTFSSINIADKLIHIQ